MLKVVTREEAGLVEYELSTKDVNRGVVDGGTVRLRNYLGLENQFTRGPQVFLPDVDQAGFTIKPHFHVVDQYQIVVRGGGVIGKHPYNPVTLHYVDAYTPYGPIVAGEDGIAWVVFRRQSDVGAHPMPGSQSEMRQRAGRSATVELQGGEPGPGQAIVTSLVEPHRDGLLAYEVAAAADTPLLDITAAGGGLYELVLAGSLCVDGREVGPLTVIHSDPGDVARRRAGKDGVHLLVCQLPTG
jgi:hypothetical protein